MARTARTKVIGSWVLVLILILGAFAGFSSVSAQEGYYVYDDFNDGVINTDLWEASGPADETGGKIVLYTNTRITASNKQLTGMQFSAIGQQNVSPGGHVDISIGTTLPFDGSDISAGIVFDDNRTENKSVVFAQWRNQYGLVEWHELALAQWGNTYTFGLEYTSDGSILVWVNGQVVHSFFVPGADILYSQGGTSFWFHTYSVVGNNIVTAEIDWANAKDVFIPPQRCVGGFGKQCEGKRLNKENGKYSGWVSVGSILHDNCCIFNYPNGFRCNNGGTDQNVCVDEWRKAKFHPFMWWVENGWGPYAEGQGDDITPVPARKSEPKTQYETTTTSRLAAPSGTKLDLTDEDFCQSRRFKEKERRGGTCF